MQVKRHGMRVINNDREEQETLQRASTMFLIYNHKGIDFVVKSESSPVTGLEWPRGFQEVKVPRFLDNGTGWW
jgi:hypothetical protein